jgi:hypothetical protein
MNKTLSDWANIAQVVSSIVVAVTLIVLIMGVRDNTAVVRASAYSNSIASLNDLSLATLSDPAAVRVWRSYIQDNASELEDLDRQRLTLILVTLFRTYENAYFSERYGLIGKSEWGRFDRNMCGHFRRVQKLGALDILRGVLATEFFEYMTDLCSG